jgi:hypothetical protein
MPGGTQSHFLAGLRALALIDIEGVPTQLLRDLVMKGAWGARLAELVRVRYPKAALVQLERGTPASLVESLGSGSKGTRAKAAQFLVAAAAEAGLTTSPHLVDKNGKPQGFGRRTKQKKIVRVMPTTTPAPLPPGKAAATASQTILLGPERAAELRWPADLSVAEVRALFASLDAFRAFLENQAIARALDNAEMGEEDEEDGEA